MMMTTTPLLVKGRNMPKGMLANTGAVTIGIVGYITVRVQLVNYLEDEYSQLFRLYLDPPSNLY